MRGAEVSECSKKSHIHNYEMNFLQATEVRINNSKELLQMIKQIGRWPVVDSDWKESDFELNGNTFFRFF